MSKALTDLANITSKIQCTPEVNKIPIPSDVETDAFLQGLTPAQYAGVIAVIEQKRYQKILEENKKKGIKPTYITQEDVTSIVRVALSLNGATIKGILDKHQVDTHKHQGWGTKVAKKKLSPTDKRMFTTTFGLLEHENNPALLLMKTYETFSLNEIKRAATFSAALKLIQKQMGTAMKHALSAKTIADLRAEVLEQRKEIKGLEEKLANSTPQDRDSRISLMNARGNTNKAIAEELGISTKTVQRVLKKLEEQGAPYQPT
ncbi:MAG: winged helix-turn-helix transcriptional regulator [Halopseudomonas sp.]